MRARNHYRDNDEHAAEHARQGKGPLGPTRPARRSDGSAPLSEDTHNGAGAQISVDRQSIRSALGAQSAHSRAGAQVGVDRQSRQAPAPTRWRFGRRRASALVLAAALASASLTACSLTSDGSSAPANDPSSRSQNADGPSPVTSDSDEPSDETSDPSNEETQTSTAGGTSDPLLCGGLLTEDLLKNKLSFTPSSSKYSYQNRPPDEYGDGRVSCELEDENDETDLSIHYTGDPDNSLLQMYVEQAESNEDGDWQPVTLDGQEGKGWVRPSNRYHKAVWVYPDGTGVVVSFLTKGDTDSSREDVAADNLKDTMHTVVAKAPEHNKNAGDVYEFRG